MEPVVQHPTCIHWLHQDTEEDMHFAKSKIYSAPKPKHTIFHTLRSHPHMHDKHITVCVQAVKHGDQRQTHIE